MSRLSRRPQVCRFVASHGDALGDETTYDERDAPLINLSLLATNTLAFTVAFAWNTGVSRSIFHLVGMDDRGSPAAVLLAAAVITLLVLMVVYIINWSAIRHGRGPAVRARWSTPRPGYAPRPAYAQRPEYAPRPAYMPRST